ncbi:hypothetical protein GGR57DRAFT_510211 [Xylariaceae sp. FL1272]|nr:hypothetical protein GGR57DRAFT_510211 [Xylariaceae sp. FL1272]
MSGSCDTVVFTDGVVEADAGTKGAGIFVTRDFPRGSLLIEQHFKTTCQYCQSKYFSNGSDSDTGDESSDTSEAVMEETASDGDKSDEDNSQEDNSEEDNSDHEISEYDNTEDNSDVDMESNTGTHDATSDIASREKFSHAGTTPVKRIGCCIINRCVYNDPAPFSYSCAPNVTSRYDKPQHVRIFTLRDLSAGEEVLTTYIHDLDSPSTIRTKTLNFDCQCAICTSSQLAESDARRMRLGGIHLGLGHAYYETLPDKPHAIMPKDDNEGLNLAQEFMEILREEGLCDWLLPEGYIQLGLFYAKNGRFDEAEDAVFAAAEANIGIYGHNGGAQFKWLYAALDYYRAKAE